MTSRPRKMIDGRQAPSLASLLKREKDLVAALWSIIDAWEESVRPSHTPYSASHMIPSISHAKSLLIELERKEP